MAVSWGLALCGFVGICQRFGEICCLHSEKLVRPKPHGAKAQHIIIIPTAVRTSNLLNFKFVRNYVCKHYPCKSTAWITYFLIESYSWDIKLLKSVKFHLPNWYQHKFISSRMKYFKSSKYELRGGITPCVLNVIKNENDYHASVVI
jgi:hypothetical protein